MKRLTEHFNNIFRYQLYTMTVMMATLSAVQRGEDLWATYGLFLSVGLAAKGVRERLADERASGNHQAPGETLAHTPK